MRSSNQAQIEKKKNREVKLIIKYTETTTYQPKTTRSEILVGKLGLIKELYPFHSTLWRFKKN